MPSTVKYHNCKNPMKCINFPSCSVSKLAKLSQSKPNYQIYKSLGTANIISNTDSMNMPTILTHTRPRIQLVSCGLSPLITVTPPPPRPSSCRVMILSVSDRVTDTVTVRLSVKSAAGVRQPNQLSAVRHLHNVTE